MDEILIMARSNTQMAIALVERMTKLEKENEKLRKRIKELLDW